jgi:hypothetical protein
MRISSFPNMRNSKKDAFMKDTYFSELCVFHKADDMMSNFSEENMYDYYKESKVLNQKQDEERISW